MKHATLLITTAAGTVTGLKMWEHKLYTNNLSAQLFDDLHAGTVNCCGTVRTNTGVVLRVFDRNETSRVTYRLA
jgi:hypothetical protein